jgi:hypothetical protein
MAVVNQADDLFVFPVAAAELGGVTQKSETRVISIAAADDDGSKYLIAELPDTAILDEITLEAPAIAGGTSYDVGIYNVDGTLVNADVFAAALDMSSTAGLPTGPTGDPIRQAMTALLLTDVNKKLYEHAGHVMKAFPASGETNRKAKYRVVITANTVGTAAATIVARVRYRNPD